MSVGKQLNEIVNNLKRLKMYQREKSEDEVEIRCGPKRQIDGNAMEQWNWPDLFIARNNTGLKQRQRSCSTERGRSRSPSPGRGQGVKHRSPRSRSPSRENDSIGKHGQWVTGLHSREKSLNVMHRQWVVVKGPEASMLNRLVQHEDTVLSDEATLSPAAVLERQDTVLPAEATLPPVATKVGDRL